MAESIRDRIANENGFLYNQVIDSTVNPDEGGQNTRTIGIVLCAIYDRLGEIVLELASAREA